MMEVDYNKLPEHIRYGMFRYIEFGNIPGFWMQMVLQNNLVNAFGYADGTNKERMADIVNFIYNEIPSPAWGSQAKLEDWAESGGARGQDIRLDHISIPEDWYKPEGVLNE